MSALQKSIMKSKLPPRCPRSLGAKLAPFGEARRKDYTPVSWKKYFDKFVDVETEGGMFRVYLSAEPDRPERPRIFTLHGGGYSGLSWAPFAEEITNMIHCQVVAMDIRGHGETKATDPDDLSAETLVEDVENVIRALWGLLPPPLLLVGHSMGGAVVVRAAHSRALAPFVQGIAVIDVVEGTAMESLASMQSFLRSRPTHFTSIEHAIEWCVRSGQVRNVDSAKVSMPSQIINCATNKLATEEIDTYVPVGLESEPTKHGPVVDSIEEEEENGEREESVFAKPSPVGDVKSNMRYKWRIDLSRTEKHWAGWFRGLSGSFLSVCAPRLLLLASVDGLDRELMQGQMQGKFQMQVLARCGHAVHEDTPHEVARVIATFAIRHQLTDPTENGEQMSLVSVPGC